MARTPKPWFRKGRGWFVTISGTQHNLGRDKKAAYHEYHRLMHQPENQRKISGQSLVAIFDDFLDWVQKNKAPDTYRWYRDLLQKFIETHTMLRVDDIRPFHVQRWVDGYPHLSKTSRRNHLRSVKRCLSWATRQGYLERNPLQHLEIPAGERKEIVVNNGEYDRILALASPQSFRDLIITTWETGCRPQESLRVEARHVDLHNQRWVIPPSEAKGEKVTRIVYLTDEAFHITHRMMLKYPEGPLFRNSNGKPWTADAVNCAFDRVRIRMGKETIQKQGKVVTDKEIEQICPTLCPTRILNSIRSKKTKSELRLEAKKKLTDRLAESLAPRYSLYALRHSWATHALERGVDSVTVAVLLGHSDPSMLAKVYQHLTQNPKFLLDQTKKATTRA